jgi:signal transduction histidine kinase
MVAAETPGRAMSGLATIGDTGRRTLAELRYFLDVLDPVSDAERAPAVDRLGDLVESMCSAGQPVELIEEGERRPMTSGAELAAYRVVQEALTNALKHAPGRPTTVRVRYGAADVDIEVSNEGPALAAARVGTGARGLAGLRERVSVVGGELRVGSRPDGGFTVRARIPVGRGH